MSNTSEIAQMRSQLKAKPIADLRKHVEAEDAAFGFGGGTFDRLKLEDGKLLKLRLFPARPGDENFYMARTAYWLDINGDNGTYRGTVLDARRHGGKKMDVVDEYVKFAKRLYATDPERIAPMIATGMNSKNLLPTNSWVSYAGIVPGLDEDGICKAQIWEFKKMVRDALNKLALLEDGEEPIEVDPFSDVDEGLPFLVKYNKNPNKKKGEDFYEVSMPKKPKAYPLSDEELEYFMSLKPLSEIVGTSTIRDFERALGGLQNFDDEHELGLFENQDWLDLVEQVRDQYDSSTDDDEPAPAKKTVVKPVSKKKAVVEESEEDEPEEDEPKTVTKKSSDPLDAMTRAELKRLISEEELEITVYKNWDEEQIRAAIRAARATVKIEPEPDEPDEPEEPEEEEPAPVQKKAATPPPASNGRLTVNDIKARLAASKKK